MLVCVLPLKAIWLYNARSLVQPVFLRFLVTVLMQGWEVGGGVGGLGGGGDSGRFLRHLSRPSLSCFVCTS